MAPAFLASDPLIGFFSKTAHEVDLATVVVPPAFFDDQVREPRREATPILTDHGNVGDDAGVAALKHGPVTSRSFEDESFVGIGNQEDAVVGAVALGLAVPFEQVGEDLDRVMGAVAAFEGQANQIGPIQCGLDTGQSALPFGDADGNAVFVDAMRETPVSDRLHAEHGKRLPNLRDFERRGMGDGAGIVHLPWDNLHGMPLGAGRVVIRAE